MIDIMFAFRSVFMNIILHGCPFDIDIRCCLIKLADHFIGVRETLWNLVIFFNQYQTVLRSAFDFCNNTVTRYRDTSRNRAIHAFQLKRKESLIACDYRNPRYIGMIQNPRQLRMIRPFLKIKSICRPDGIFNYFCSEPGTTEICFAIHIHIHRFRIKRTRKIQLTTFMNSQSMSNHIRSRLLQRLECLSRKLHLSFEIGMLVHKVEQIIINDWKITPDCRAYITIVVHVSMQNITHINLFCFRLCIAPRRSCKHRQHQCTND